MDNGCDPQKKHHPLFRPFALLVEKFAIKKGTDKIQKGQECVEKVNQIFHLTPLVFWNQIQTNFVCKFRCDCTQNFGYDRLT